MATQPATITVKSKLVGENDIRRITFPADGLTFDVLSNKLATLYAYKDISTAKIKYLDPESDKITISSDEELDEALKLIGSDNILRIFIVPATQQASATGQNATFAERVEMATSTLLEDINNPALDSVIRGLVADITANMPAVVKRRPAERRLMRILRRRVFQSMNDKVHELFNSTKTEDLTLARDLLTAQLAIFPNDIASMYNLACAESRLDNKDAACAALRKSVDMGFHRLRHMQNDKDLDNIRNEVMYAEILSELEKNQHMHGRRGGCRRGRGRFGGRRGRGRGRRGRFCGSEHSDEDSKPEEDAEESTEEKQPVASEPTPSEDEQELPEGITQSAVETANNFERSLESLSGMGFADRKNNIEALVHSRGDLTGAVQYLLNN